MPLETANRAFQIGELSVDDVHRKIPQYSLRDMAVNNSFKEKAHINDHKIIVFVNKDPAENKAEEFAINKKKAVEHALKIAAESKAAAEMARKMSEKNTSKRELKGGNVYRMILKQFLTKKENISDSEDHGVLNIENGDAYRFKTPVSNKAAEVRINKQKAIEHALKVAADSKAAAEMARTSVDKKKS